jgi:hypothetical protein
MLVGVTLAIHAIGDSSADRWSATIVLRTKLEIAGTDIER